MLEDEVVRCGMTGAPTHKDNVKELRKGRNCWKGASIGRGNTIVRCGMTGAPLHKGSVKELRKGLSCWKGAFKTALWPDRGAYA